MSKTKSKWLYLDPNTVKIDASGNIAILINENDAIEATAEGLKVKQSGVKDSHLEGNIAFDKLADKENIARLDQAETINNNWTFAIAPKSSAVPQSSDDLVNKLYSDISKEGYKPKNALRVAVLDVPVTLTGVQTLQSVALGDGDRVGVGANVDPKENGYYVVRGGAWERTDDFSVGMDISGARTFIEEGTLAGRRIVTTNLKGDDICGTANIGFTVDSSLEKLQAGNGLDKSGDEVALNPLKLIKGGNAELDGDKLDIDYTPSAYTPATGAEADSAEHLTAHLKGIDNAISNVVIPRSEGFTLATQDIANRFVELALFPSDAEDVILDVKHGSPQFYGDDFIMDGSVANRVTWAGLGLDGMLEVGDKIRVSYSA